MLCLLSIPSLLLAILANVFDRFLPLMRKDFRCFGGLEVNSASISRFELEFECSPESEARLLLWLLLEEVLGERGGRTVVLMRKGAGEERKQVEEEEKGELKGEERELLFLLVERVGEKGREESVERGERKEEEGGRGFGGGLKELDTTEERK